MTGRIIAAAVLWVLWLITVSFRSFMLKKAGGDSLESVRMKESALIQNVKTGKKCTWYRKKLRENMHSENLWAAELARIYIAAGDTCSKEVE